MITKAKFTRDGVSVRGDYGEHSLGIKWTLINSGLAAFLFEKEVKTAMPGPAIAHLKNPDTGQVTTHDLSSVIFARAATHPQELALCRMWWALDRGEIEAPFNSWTLAVPEIGAAQKILRDGKFGFDPVEV